MNWKIPAALPQRNRLRRNTDRPEIHGSGQPCCVAVMKMGVRGTFPFPNYDGPCWLWQENKIASLGWR